MKKVELLYGKGVMPIEVPDDAVVIEPRHINGLKDEKAAVVEALRNPLGTLPLKQTVTSTDKVAIVISDLTRPTPNHKLVPWILEELSHVPAENFVIINGTGTHRDQTREEFIQMLGSQVVERIRVINHHCHQTEELSKVGSRTFGCDVYLNKAYVEADIRIVTGFIEPHFFAGFSGGPKGIMPGIAGIETILTFHNARMIGDPLATWGNMNNNPLQLMAREVNQMCKPPKELLALIEDPAFQRFDQWQVQKQAVVLTWADVYMRSELTDEAVRNAMLKPIESVESALAKLRLTYGEQMSVAVLPMGPLTIPYVRD